MSQDPADFLRAYADAIAARDIDAFIGLYRPDARIYDSFGQWAYEGLDEWRAATQEWFNEMTHGGVGVAENVLVFDGGTLATVAADVKYGNLDEDGKVTDYLYNRYTATLVRDSVDEDWRVAVEHTSLPLGMDEMTPIFKK